MKKENLIKISAPWIESNENKAKLCAKITACDKEDYILWYEVDKKYEKFLCYEKSDAFILNLLMYAMEKGYDIESEQAVSEQFFYGVTEFFIPTISKHVQKYKKINITAPISNCKLTSENAVGASVSCGVDSFYTILRNLNRKEKSFNVTHLNFFNAGSNGNYGGEEARQKYNKRVELVSPVAEELGLPMVCVDTNANEYILQKHLGTETPRTLAVTLALQKLYGKYYLASGFPYEKFELSNTEMAPYDLFSLKCFSTENLTFYSSGAEVTRQEKLDYISNFKIAQKNINVCIHTIENCGKCEKCKRTMMGLYALNKLDDFKESFNVEYFYKNKMKYMINTVAYRNKHDWEEIYAVMKASKKIPRRAYFLGGGVKFYLKLRSRMASIKWVKKLYKSRQKRKNKKSK